ncbi:endonuclease/exonuclease/phosphatase family protein, partial [Streptomyces cyaneofuscatus]|uniref:endonuclease/exonuclease/phosphatase family protein n=1 Tax=Streptomyces cyaneofuscatus TaxID=66883 RepID=UPI003403AC2C
IDALPLEPKRYALDLYEALEGARVQIADTRVTGATTAYDEIWVTVKPKENPTRRGGTLYASYTDQNTGRLKVMSLDPAQPVPTANVGDVLKGRTTGVLDYASYGGYNVQATELGTHVDKKLRREVTRKQKKDELAVATYNVENLDAADPQAKFDTLAEGIAVNLSSPDIVSLEEIQDDNGPVNDGTVGSEATLKRFTDAIVAKGGPRYAWRYIAPENNKDGGEPGGNIRNVLLHNAQRVSFTDRPGGDATTPVKAVKTRKGVQLSVSPGRINPASPAWEASRKPLVGEFTFRGKPVFVIGNHFGSKGGDQPLHGRYQEPNRSSETKRIQQAAEVNAFVTSLLKADKSAQVVALGDFNDFEFSPTFTALTQGKVLKPLIKTLPASERYSYVFDGNSQTLDHILTSPAVRRFDYDVVHINAEFADQASDHDPQVVRIKAGGFRH